MNLSSFARQEAKQKRATELRHAECFAIAQSPIKYEPHLATATERDKALDIDRANAAMNAPLFCVHGKLARIQCKRCG